jgi:hypothetical protein
VEEIVNELLSFSNELELARYITPLGLECKILLARKVRREKQIVIDKERGRQEERIKRIRKNRM